MSKDKIENMRRDEEMLTGAERNSIWEERCIISPSLICLDMLHLEDQIRKLERCGIRMLHLDILDGHFSPSMPLGFEAIRQLRQVTDMEFECHVMADPPAYFIDELLNIGVSQIVFQVETAVHIDHLLSHIYAEGTKAGLALMPSTPLSVLEYELEKCDAVLLMQINPGYASDKKEKKISFVDKKIRELRKMIDGRNLHTKIILDGRVSVKDIEEYGRDTADIFVGGTTCIDKNDIAGSLAKVARVREKILI